MVREAERFPARCSAGAGSGNRDENGPALAGRARGTGLGRWDDLPDATLPWDRVSELAEKQGIGEADVVWDLTAGDPAGAAESPRRAQDRAREARPQPSSASPLERSFGGYS